MVSGSIISSVGLDRGVAKVFHEDETEDEDKSSPEKVEENEDKVKYDNITVHPLLFKMTYMLHLNLSKLHK